MEGASNHENTLRQQNHSTGWSQILKESREEHITLLGSYMNQPHEQRRDIQNNITLHFILTHNDILGKMFPKPKKPRGTQNPIIQLRRKHDK